MNVDRDWLKAQIRTVLLATDFLQSSRLALDYAAAFTHHFNAQLMVVNAFELDPVAKNVEVVDHKPSRTRRDAEARLQAFTLGIDKLGVSVKWALVEGTVPKGILKAVSEHKADLLVLGTQGVHRGLSHLLIGSNTEALMLASPCPSLTIGPHVQGGIGLDLGFTKILYISDFSVAAAAAAPFVQALAEDLRADVEIYQVLPDAVRNNTLHVHQLAKQYCAALTSLQPKTCADWCTPEFQLNRIRSEEAVLARSMDTTALIALGVQPASYMGRHLHTSFAYRLLANAACPILTVLKK
jgi:nucleotide-binding universal stress UspA family protein